jgi:endonuclease V-like protein UPF0215 family
LSGDCSHMLQALFKNERRLPRAVGFDDGPSTIEGIGKLRGFQAVLLGVWFRGLQIHHVRLGVLTVDGLDVTDTMLRLLRHTRADLIFLSGASFAGFNLIDSKALHAALGIPAIVVSRDKPDNVSVKHALKKHFADWRTRWRLVRELGRIHEFAPLSGEEPLYFEAVGLPAVNAKRVIRAYCVTSRVPEPIRVAGLLAKGLAPAGRELKAA